MNRAGTRALWAGAAALLLLTACSSSKKTTSASATTAAPPATEAPTTAAPPTTAAATTTTAPAQTVTITPNTGLTDGQTVQIVGKGYTAGKKMSAVECADKGANTGAGDCNLRNIPVATPDATGTVTVAFKVAKGPFGSNNIVCSATQGCLVSVATAGAANPDEVATATIAFSG